MTPTFFKAFFCLLWVCLAHAQAAPAAPRIYLISGASRIGENAYIFLQVDPVANTSLTWEIYGADGMLSTGVVTNFAQPTIVPVTIKSVLRQNLVMLIRSNTATLHVQALGWTEVEQSRLQSALTSILLGLTAYLGGVLSFALKEWYRAWRTAMYIKRELVRELTSLTIDSSSDYSAPREWTTDFRFEGITRHKVFGPAYQILRDIERKKNAGVSLEDGELAMLRAQLQSLNRCWWLFKKTS